MPIALIFTAVSVTTLCTSAAGLLVRMRYRKLIKEYWL